MIAMLALWAVLAAIGTVVLQRHLRKLEKRRQAPKWAPDLSSVQVFLTADVRSFVRAMDKASRAIADFQREYLKAQEAIRQTSPVDLDQLRKLAASLAPEEKP